MAIFLIDFIPLKYQLHKLDNIGLKLRFAKDYTSYEKGANCKISTLIQTLECHELTVEYFFSF